MKRRLTVITAGPYTSIQDQGRTGNQALGVPEGGVLDREAMALGNALVGNSADAAVLECCMGGLRMRLDSAARIALTGTVEGVLIIETAHGSSLKVPSGRSIDLAAGRVIQLPPMPDSNTATLALSGGIETAPVYGSRGTTPNVRIGGLDGNLLADGDILPLGQPVAIAEGEMQLATTDIFLKRQTIRLVLGPQEDRFTDAGIETLTTHPYKLSPVLNRMGMRLVGPILEHEDGADILSDGIVSGSVQVPGDGKPIILLADHQSTGGYTKIATVISADLPALARLQPADEIRFIAISAEEAVSVAREQQSRLDSLLASMQSASALFDLDALYSLGDTT